MARLHLARATTEAVHHIATHLREADQRELRAVHGDAVDFRALLRTAVLASADVCVLKTDDEEPVAVVGVAPVSLLGGQGSPWALGTERVDDFPREVVRLGRVMVARWAAQYDQLFNYVDTRNTRSIRWLRGLGFVMAPAAPYGRAGLPFHRFEGARNLGQQGHSLGKLPGPQACAHPPPPW